MWKSFYPLSVHKKLFPPDFDYVLDCIDSITPKLNLIVAAKRKKVKVISNMGAGGKFLSQKIVVRDISKTEVCPLAKNIRKRLKKKVFQVVLKGVFLRTSG